MHVPIRELKDRLSEYLRLTAEGEEIIITLHKRPIAKLVPMANVPESELDLIGRLNALTWVRPGNGKVPQGARNITRPPKGGKLVSELVDPELINKCAIKA